MMTTEQTTAVGTEGTLVGRFPVRYGARAVLDQAVFASGNLTLNILLGRMLAASDYGTYSVVGGIMILAAGLHTGFLVEPYTVLGPSPQSGRFREYLTIARHAHWKIAIGISAVLMAGGVLSAWAGSAAFGYALAAAAIAGPLIWLTALLRRALYVLSEIPIATLGGVWYGTVAILLVLVSHRIGVLTPATAVAAAGLGALVCVWWIDGRARWSSCRGAPSRLGDHADGMWTYARAAVAVQVLMWLSGNVYFVAVGWFGSLESAAALRAVMNLLLPIQHVVIGIAGALLPSMVRARSDGGSKAVLHQALGVARLLIPVAVAYSLALFLTVGPLMKWVYGGRYDDERTTLYLGLLLPLLWVLASISSNALRALGRPLAVLWGYGAGSAVLALSVPFLQGHGARAGLLGWTGSLTVAIVVMTCMLRDGHGARAARYR